MLVKINVLKLAKINSKSKNKPPSTSWALKMGKNGTKTCKFLRYNVYKINES